jgi:protein-L-isoaspartate(D-aspartate) O-methyltransferase
MNSMGGKALADYLNQTGVLKTKQLYDAFVAVDRKDFVPEYLQDEAYEDHALPIGHGQTISQPYTVAFMLELLQPKTGNTVLDIGSGSGWTTALLAQIVGPEGSVFGLELVPELVKFGQQNLAKYDFKHAQIRQAKQEELAVPKKALFDRILASASADSLPDELIKRLQPPGRLVVPVRHSILSVQKTADSQIVTTEYPGFVFVPLLS